MESAIVAVADDISYVRELNTTPFTYSKYLNNYSLKII